MINTLVFSGGGIKVIYYIGLIQLLEKYKLMDNINKFIGTSSGAIFCLLLSINLNSNNIIKLLNNIDINKLIGEYDILNILDNFGLSDSENLIKIISIITKNKLKLNNIEELTFKKHYELTNNKLLILVTNLTDNKSEILSYDTNPNMNILDAIKISCNVPLLFKKIDYNNKIYCDGGIMCNYPITYTDDISTTIGMCQLNTDIRINNFTDYLYKILNILFINIYIYL